MARFDSKRKANFLSSLPVNSLEESDVASRSSFCFSFLDPNQVAGKSFEEWNESRGALAAIEIIKKVKEFSREPLEYWKNSGSKPLVIYGDFPKDSDFKHPSFVPHDVLWGRFRLGNKIRIAGFVVPDCLHGKEVTNGKSSYILDRNVFYVVFLDKDHRFYKVEAP